MEAVRESWTDERLDDFTAETARRFDSVERRIDTLERRMDEGFRSMRADMDAGFREMRAEMNARFEANHRTTVQLFGIALGAFVGLISVQTALLVALL
jgi:hypothetical protein